MLRRSQIHQHVIDVLNSPSRTKPKPEKRHRVRWHCDCGTCNVCKFRERRKWFTEMRRRNLVGCGRKWSLAYAKDDLERFLVRVANNKDWMGPRLGPLGMFEMLEQAAIYPTGLPRSGRVRPRLVCA